MVPVGQCFAPLAADWCFRPSVNILSVSCVCIQFLSITSKRNLKILGVLKHFLRADQEFNNGT